LQEQIKELQKSFPITYYEQNPSLWNYARKEFLNKYGLLKSIYYYFNKKLITYFIEAIIFVYLMKLWKLFNLNSFFTNFSLFK
jgi:hypothetical protein